MVFRGLSKALLLLGTPRLVAQCFSFGSPWVSLDPKKKGALKPLAIGSPDSWGVLHPSGQRTPAGDPALPQAGMGCAFGALWGRISVFDRTIREIDPLPERAIATANTTARTTATTNAKAKTNAGV